MRLINADALNQYKFGEQLMTSSYSEGWDDAIDAIMKDAPTVEERPQGEWIEKRDNLGHIQLFCNKCGIKAQVGFISFCGKCGAQMKKEEST